MATDGERRILGFLISMALIGAGVRAVGVQRFEKATIGAPDRTAAAGAARALSAQRAAVESARAAPRATRSKTKARAGPKRPPPFPIDINAASARELEALPRVGPALAQRIIERRNSVGAYRSLEDLRHVRGIGPATLRLFDTLVTFSGRHSPLHSGEPPPAGNHTAHALGRKSRHYGCSCCTFVGSYHRTTRRSPRTRGDVDT